MRGGTGRDCEHRAIVFRSSVRHHLTLTASNRYMENGRHLVGRLKATDDLRSSIEHTVGLIGGIRKSVGNGDLVTIKPNLNTADPYPASSDPMFIQALGEALIDAGASKLRIVESSMISLSTRKAAAQVGMDKVADSLGAEMVYLDEGKWTRVSIRDGKYLRSVSVGAPVAAAGKLVLAPCLKTHKYARFTASMKMFVGWTKPTDRLKMHSGHLEEKVAELASYFSPDLVVMDARRVFVTGGPASGDVEEPGLILTSGNVLAADVVGLRILKGYRAKNRLDMDIWDLPQVKRAAEMQIGPRSDEDILVREE